MNIALMAIGTASIDDWTFPVRCFRLSRGLFSLNTNATTVEKVTWGHLTEPITLRKPIGAFELHREYKIVFSSGMGMSITFQIRIEFKQFHCDQFGMRETVLEGRIVQ